MLNANFHLDFPGVLVRNETGAFNGQLAMNLTALLGPEASGWQKLNMQGKILDPLTGATNTGEEEGGRLQRRLPPRPRAVIHGAPCCAPQARSTCFSRCPTASPRPPPATSAR
jgi:hypothetical protein